MLGNVWEWCADDWHGSYEGAPSNGTAWIDVDGGAANRVLCGGSWKDEARSVRSASRDQGDTTFRGDFLGFRCAKVTAERPQ
jgi:formylglycine-generating enzyme required for sulfatase activity